MGNKTVIKCNLVQRMSAGTGLTHSEFNLADTPVHFFQIWIFPDNHGLKPTCDQKTFNAADWKNCLLPLASGQNKSGAVPFHTDTTIYRCDLDKGITVPFEIPSGRRIFVYVTNGMISANGEMLSEKDQARIDIEEPLFLKAEKPSEFILIDVPSCKGWGYNAEILRGQRK